MASLVKIARLTPKLKYCFQNKQPITGSSKLISLASRTISTSKKSKDTVPVQEPVLGFPKNDSETEVVPEKYPKNWISWGFSESNIEDDNTHMHLIFFFTVTLCLVGSGFFYMYVPDQKMIEWIKREAFLELRRREAEGLPPVDRDLIPVDTFELPSDDELGDIQITI